MENTKINRGGVYKNGCISPSEEKEQLTFIDFFAGVGGFHRGLELAGWKCVGFCEFDKYATASYTSMHLITEEQRKYLETLPLKKRQKEILKDEYRNGEWYVSDIRDANARNLPKSDCWCFGAPCQDFSVAGKRAGLDGDRSSLIREIFRLLEEQEEQDRPEWLIYENVKGMLSSNKGLDYLSILSEMDRFGYDVEWQNINSKWFVPQNRERIYTVGHLRRFGSRKIFPVEGTDGKDSFQQNITLSIEANYPSGNQKSAIYGLRGISRTLTATDYKQPISVVLPVLTPDRVQKRQNGRRFKEDGEPMFTLTAQDRHGVAMSIIGHTMKDSENISHCLNANDQRKVFGVKQERTMVGVRYTADGFHLYRNDKKRSSIQGTHVTYPNGNVHCLNAAHIPMTMKKVGTIEHRQCEDIYIEMPEGFVVYAVWYEKYQCYITIRKLTPKECFRLQGWTDDYFEKATFVNSDSQLYKQAGNGVTVDVVKAIGERIVSSR